jgi:hypothetical protein
MQHNSTYSRAYPCKCLTFGCIATSGVSNFRLHSNGGIRPNTSQYFTFIFRLRCKARKTGIRTATSKTLLSCWFTVLLNFQAWRWKWYDPWNHQPSFEGLQCFVLKTIHLFVSRVCIHEAHFMVTVNVIVMPSSMRTVQKWSHFPRYELHGLYNFQMECSFLYMVVLK